MTHQKNKKTLVRERMAKTGEAYQTAHRAISSAKPADTEVTDVVLAVFASSPPPPPPPTLHDPEAVPVPELAAGPVRFALRFAESTRTGETTWKTGEIQELELPEGTFVIGRASACDFTIGDQMASRRHARFTVENGRVTVEDLESQNGVWVNRKRIHEPKEIWKDDMVLVALHEFKLVKRGVAELAPPARPKTVDVAKPVAAKPEAAGAPAVGTVLSSRYRLERLAKEKSRGAFVVYDAEHTLLGGDVAIKLLPAAAARSTPHLKAWLLREGRALTRAAHPRVARVFDIGESESNDVYLVLERARGMGLDAYVSLKGAGPATALEVVRQLAEILEHLHAKGIVVRGLKNDIVRVEVGEEGITVGLSSLAFASIRGEARLEPAGSVFGEPAWMSPEQTRGEETDARSDLYALGVVFYQMLTGKLPFDTEDRSQLLELHRTSAPPALRDASEPPSPLDAMCLKLLAKRPEDRYASARGLLDELPHALEDLAIH